MHWDDRAFGLGVAAMDATHREFFELVATAIAATDEDFPACFERLLAHTEAHFAQEGALMRECACAASAEHESEHRRILADLGQLAVRVRAGRLSMARAYVEGLTSWFIAHLGTMDSALAASLKTADSLADEAG